MTTGRFLKKQPYIIYVKNGLVYKFQKITLKLNQKFQCFDKYLIRLLGEFKIFSNLTQFLEVSSE